MLRLLSGFLLAVLSLQAAGGSAEEHRRRANDHYFNLEYQQALVEYYQALEAEGDNPSDWNHIATTLLYSELHRLGKLETSAFKGDNDFLGHEKPEPDPRANRRFLGAIQQARRLAEVRLRESAKNPAALFSLSSSYALEANYQFMIEKSYVTALRNGMKAKKYSEQALKSDPELIDAYLTPGVQEYVVGSLPWIVKALVALGGVTGSKKKGMAMVRRVADEGDVLRTEARMLLVLLHRREGRPLEAAGILGELIEEFPRNYVLRLEMGSMLADAEQPRKALAVFETSLAMVRADEHEFGRMPARLREALERKIEGLREELETRAEAK